MSLGDTSFKASARMIRAAAWLPVLPPVSASMGMKVAEFKHLKVTGDQAEAVASMQEAEGMVGAKVRWTFRFARDKSGAWTVTEHKQ